MNNWVFDNIFSKRYENPGYAAWSLSRVKNVMKTRTVYLYFNYDINNKGPE